MSEGEIPNPDDDFSEKTNKTIDFMIKKYEPHLLELIDQFHYSHTPNSYRRILSFCVRNLKFLRSIGSITNNEDLNECIKQMNKVSHNISPHDKMHIMSLANQMGEIYIQIWESME